MAKQSGYRRVGMDRHFLTSSCFNHPNCEVIFVIRSFGIFPLKKMALTNQLFFQWIFQVPVKGGR